MKTDNEVLVDLIALEDEDVWFFLIKEAISKHFPNCRLRMAQKGKDFLRLLGEAPPPNLVISDVNMLEMSGLDVLKKIRARHDLDWLPIVMLSSDPDPDAEVYYLTKGASAYYRKPARDIHLLLGNIIEKHAYRGVKPDRIEPLVIESKPTNKITKSKLDDFLNSW